MKKMINETHIEGLLYDQDLKLKTTGPDSKTPGVDFITGTISIATDDACLNIVPIHFTYTTEKTTTGKVNSSFTLLKNIIDGNIKTYLTAGKDGAGKIRCDSAIDLNDFYTERDGKEELVSTKRNEGGFLHTADTLAEDEKTRNTFKCDMIITHVHRIDGDPDKNTTDKVIVHGAIFNFRNALLPVEFSATNPNAMTYFENLEASDKHPVFTKVWGRQISETTTRKIVEQSAFGEDYVREVQNNHKDWVITGAASEPYLWDSEDTITATQLKDAAAQRETYLATVKQRQDEYKASKNAPAAAPASANGGFNF